jgi:small GTP-binding protein
MVDAPPLSFKFILIGDSGVGKTALLRRLVDDTFNPDTQSTIGVEFDSTSLEVDGHPVKLQIWDTAGQERFRSIAKAYFRNAVGVILVFEIGDHKTFEATGMWLSEVRSLCDPAASVVLIGNKCDIRDDRTVTLQEAEQFAHQSKISYIETSALDGTNVREAFLRVAAEIYRKGRQVNTDEDDRPVAQTGGKSCCGS